ncbi:putative Rho GTPase-activating protein domain, Rho GTPase activation protein [Trachipleistophora hominis]|uniref:Putative Rho GTPase-activating protein domain, Rho GTPase activation protein n=1 Tax=Trachipleistophora hominis TaxID=72359 RepID=L7JYL2_TRAHO|nr:putative Rho GTPase-activating protein domain, Rho GTPase activation protein [Trachipleistophora hominis]
MDVADHKKNVSRSTGENDGKILETDKKKDEEEKKRTHERYNRCTKFDLNRCSRSSCSCSTSEYIKYIDLSNEEQYWLAMHCIRTLLRMKTKKKNTLLMIIDRIEKIFLDEDLNFIPQETVDTRIFDLLDHFEAYAPSSIGFLRLPGKKDVYHRLLDLMNEPAEIDFSKYEMRDNCSFFKLYIREKLKGIIYPCLASSLYYFYDRNRKDELCKIKKYLPFVFIGHRRKLLLRILHLYRKIGNNEEITKMSIRSLVVCSTPSFFPASDANVALPAKQVKIFESLFDMQFKYVSRDLLDESEKLRIISTTTDEDEFDYGYDSVNEDEFMLY